MTFDIVDKMLLLILLLSLSVNVGQCLKQDECSPAQEERPYTMECFIHLNSGVAFFIWNRDSESDKKQLAKCSGSELNCKDEYSDHYSTRNTFSVNKTILTSQLTINNVSPKDRNQTFECKIWNTVSEKHSVVKTCVLRTYRLPENLRCQAQRLGSNAIEVSCQISLFFPEVVCDMSQLYGDVLETMSGNVSYQNKQTIYESGDQYHSIVCSSVVKIEFPGTYTFLVKVYPKIRGQIYYQSGVEVFTNEVKFSPMVSIKVEQTPELSDCQNSEDMTTFICLVESFIKPRFQWYLGDILLSTDPNITFQELNQTTFTNVLYESKYTLSINSSHHGYNLTCEAFYDNFYSDSEESYESLNSSIKIRALTRLPPPVFKDNEGTQLGDVYELHLDTAVDLSCEVEGEQQEDIYVSFLGLDCRDSVDVRDNLISLKSSGASLEFIINLSETGNSRNISCSCFAEYSNSCQNVSFTSLLLIQNYESQTENSLAEKQKGKELTWPWLIFGGILMGIGLAFLAFIVTFLHDSCTKKKTKRITIFY